MTKTAHPQVVKSNHIIEASYRLSVPEQRIVLACIAQVRRDEPLTDQKLYNVSAADLAALTGTDQKTAYRDLEEAAARLFERRVTITKEPNGRTRSPRKMLTRWVQSVVYVEGEGRVELRFGTDMIPFLSGLTEQFTRYSLSAVAKMDSAYAIRLFELLMQWKDEGEREITVVQLREWLQLEDRYPLFGDVKRWVIDPAVTQINERSPLFVEWAPKKAGRRIVAILFTFREKPVKKPRKPRTKRLTDAEVARKSLPGESWETARSRLHQMPLDLEPEQ